MKVYKTFTKTMYHLCINKGKAVEFPLIGKFIPNKKDNQI